MAAYKDKNMNTWYTSFYYEDWKGERRRKLKRGFATKREALEWEREFQRQQSADLDMTFENFIEIYTKDVQFRLKENTWQIKQNIIETKLLPALGKKKMNEIPMTIPGNASGNTESKFPYRRKIPKPLIFSIMYA